MRLCECGCGKPTKIATRNHLGRGLVKGKPQRFIHGHNGIGSMNGRWVGDNVGYSGGHTRVRAVRGRANGCEFCGENRKGRKYEWASVSKNYADPLDYKSACVPCHKRFDISPRRMREISKCGNDTIRKRIRNGWKLPWVPKGQKRVWIPPV